MKSTSAFAACFSILLLTTLSCRKEGAVENRQRVEPPEMIMATVPSGQPYAFTVNAGNTLSIKKQALHYQVSEISALPDGRINYRYAAVKGYSGDDEVTLLQSTTTTTIASGGCYSGQSNEYKMTSLKTIVIKFQVAN